ncbi:HAMP domain-containing sensor histidine kinase [Vibrio sp. FNV 38]|nr:HAMP domain-containing sensor histidine kinase [Vibrio sp. FNV 38]
MSYRYFYNTKRMTHRLAWFFAIFSVVIGVLCFLMVTASLYWSEDRVNERRIIIDRDDAIAYFRLFPNAKSVKLDSLTHAYRDIETVPGRFVHYLQDKESYLGEVNDDPNSQMLYLGQFESGGETHPIIILSLVDAVEMSQREFAIVAGAALLLMTIMLVFFGVLLNRLSTRLIAPFNQLSRQLRNHEGDTSQQFEVADGAATEFQELAKRLNQYRAQVNALFKREQAFARYASHELRTPLTVMKGSTGLLARGQHNQFEQRQIDRISEATNQMSNMVDALLSLVRYERGQENTPLRVLSESEVSSILAQHRALADQKGIELTFDYTGSPYIKASSAIIQILLSNLLRNAIAASDQCHIKVDLDVTKLKVIDRGSGLSKDNPQKMQERSTGDSQTQEGHGLGLLIVHDLCQRYGWHFSLQNSQQGGCIATIDFTPDTDHSESSTPVHEKPS